LLFKSEIEGHLGAVVLRFASPPLPQPLFLGSSFLFFSCINPEDKDSKIPSLSPPSGCSLQAPTSAKILWELPLSFSDAQFKSLAPYIAHFAFIPLIRAFPINVIRTITLFQLDTMSFFFYQDLTPHCPPIHIPSRNVLRFPITALHPPWPGIPITPPKPTKYPPSAPIPSPHVRLFEGNDVSLFPLLGLDVTLPSSPRDLEFPAPRFFGKHP